MVASLGVNLGVACHSAFSWVWAACKRNVSSGQRCAFQYITGSFSKQADLRKVLTLLDELVS